MSPRLRGQEIPALPAKGTLSLLHLHESLAIEAEADELRWGRSGHLGARAVLTGFGARGGFRGG